MTGRPTVYDPRYCELAEKFLAKGHSKFALSGELNVCEKTLYNWIDKHEAFLQAIKKGEALGLKLFETILIAKLSGQDIKGFDSKKSDTACLIFALKTRFWKVYGDKSKLMITDNDDDLDFTGS